MAEQFDAEALAQRLREESMIRRKRPYRSSRLDRFSGELIRLHAAGARPAELQRWLAEQRIKATHSTVSRWLKRKGSQNGKIC